MITRRSEVLGELAEFLALGTASVIDEEGVLMLEASEEPLELGEDVLILLHGLGRVIRVMNVGKESL